MKILNLSVYWALIFLLALTSKAQEISLTEFLLIAQKHQVIQKQQLAVEIAEKTRDAARGDENWYLSASPYYLSQDILGGAVFSPDRVDQIAASASLERKLWSTGGKLALGLSAEKTEQVGLRDIIIPGVFTIPAGPESYYKNYIHFRYSQPLLQNFRGNLDRLGYDLLQLSHEISKIERQEADEDFLLSSAIQFIDWVSIAEQKKIARERLDLAKQQLNQIEKKRASNLVEPVDVLRAEDAVQLAEQGLLLIQSQLKGKLSEIITFYHSEKLHQDSEPIFDLYSRKVIQDQTEMLSTLKNRSRVLRIVQLHTDQLRRQSNAARERAKGQLNLITEASVVGGGEAGADALGMENRDIGIFVNYRMPIGNTRAKREVERSELELKQIHLARDEAELKLLSMVSGLCEQIGEIEKVMDINQRQLETGKLRTEAELKRYNQGRSDLTFVLQSQDSEKQTRLAYAQNAALYHKLHLQLAALLDELFPAEIEADAIEGE